MNAKLFLTLLVVLLLSSCASENLSVEKPELGKKEEKKQRSSHRFLASDYR